MTSLPAIAPRRHHFVVTSLSHVAGPGIAVHTRRCGQQLSDAKHVADAIDWRLWPRVELARDDA